MTDEGRLGFADRADGQDGLVADIPRREILVPVDEDVAKLLARFANTGDEDARQALIEAIRRAEPEIDLAPDATVTLLPGLVAAITADLLAADRNDRVVLRGNSDIEWGLALEESE